MFALKRFLHQRKVFCTNNFARHSSSTIFALSSGHGKCGVAVIRVSGSRTRTAIEHMTDFSESLKPRMAYLRSIKHPITKETLDKGLVLWFPGEDCAEFQVHGGVAVVNSILSALLSIPHCRLAEPGEFTRRAFYNGKLDLTEVEGLSDLLQAETEIQRRQAFLQTQGALSKLYNKWRKTLVTAVAHIEAHIDFEETETLDEDVFETVNASVDQLTEEMELHLNDGRKGEMLRSGVKTVIIGEPNVGKSSLFNVLCQRPAAIVTPIEGTTRDVLEVTLNIGGYPLLLTDTAGLRFKTTDIIEKEGINRAIESYENADLVILVIDAQKCSNWLSKHTQSNYTDYLKCYIKTLNLSNLIKNRTTATDEGLFNKPCIVVFNKIDLLNHELEASGVTVSCKSEDGVTELVEVLTQNLKRLCGEPSAEHPSMNQVRHRQHLSNCLTCLRLFLKKDSAGDLVLMAEYLRKALKHLGHLVGSTTTEQLLDVIFKDFCIGK